MRMYYELTFPIDRFSWKNAALQQIPHVPLAGILCNVSSCVNGLFIHTCLARAHAHEVG